MVIMATMATMFIMDIMGYDYNGYIGHTGYSGFNMLELEQRVSCLVLVSGNTRRSLPLQPPPPGKPCMHLPKEMWVMVDYLLQRGLDHVRRPEANYT